MKVGVIGAGPAGITAAYQLAKFKIPVEVFEASGGAGGMAKTIALWDQKVDIGPHRFYSKDKRVNELWLEVVQKDYEIIDRLTRIYYKGKFYDYPLKPFNALSNIGVWQSIVCVLSLFKEKISPTKLDGSFENWVISRFGRRLYEIFFKPYSEKLWGISCKELDSDFAAQRIKKLSLFEAIKNAFFKNKTQKHKTLVDQFAYPLEGTGVVYQRMAECVERQEGKMFYNSPVQKILIENQRVVGLELVSKEIKKYDAIISSMPLTLLVSRLQDAPAEVKAATDFLTFRNTIIVYLHISSENLFPDQWLYIQSPDLQTGRITNFRNWAPTLYGKEKGTILAMEYWCYDHDPIWKASDEELMSLAKEELKKIGFKTVKFVARHKEELVKNKKISPEFEKTLKSDMRHADISKGSVYRIPRCYPVYKKGYKSKLKIIEDYLDTIQGLTVIGRYGAFKYNNQDHSILMGILAAENIAKKTNHDLWGINTDYEDYQESYVIKKTGLVKE